MSLKTFFNVSTVDRQNEILLWIEPFWYLDKNIGSYMPLSFCEVLCEGWAELQSLRLMWNRNCSPSNALKGAEEKWQQQDETSAPDFLGCLQERK